MKAITIKLQDICQEYNGKIGKIVYDEVTFTKAQYPKSAAKMALIELELLGVYVANIYSRKSLEYSVDVKVFEKYLEGRGISFPRILEPTVKIIVT